MQRDDETRRPQNVKHHRVHADQVINRHRNQTHDPVLLRQRQFRPQYHEFPLPMSQRQPIPGVEAAADHEQQYGRRNETVGEEAQEHEHVIALEVLDVSHNSLAQPGQRRCHFKVRRLRENQPRSHVLPLLKYPVFRVRHLRGELNKSGRYRFGVKDSPNMCVEHPKYVFLVVVSSWVRISSGMSIPKAVIVNPRTFRFEKRN